MIQDGLDNVRRRAQVRQPGGDGSPDVVHVPVRYLRALVERALVLDPPREAVAALTEKLGAAHPLRYGADDVERRRHERQRVLAVVFRPARWNREDGAVEVDLRPAHVANFSAPTASEDQQLDDLAVLVIAAGAPNGGDLGV